MKNMDDTNTPNVWLKDATEDTSKLKAKLDSMTPAELEEFRQCLLACQRTKLFPDSVE